MRSTDIISIGIENNKYICYICGKEYKTKATLYQHIKKSKNEKHEQYRQHFNELKEYYIKNNDYLNISCSDKCKCNDCIYANDCLRLEKKLFDKIKQQAIREEKKQQVKKKKVFNRNAALELVKEFYIFYQNSIEYKQMIAEAGKINRLLNEYTPDQIRSALNYFRDMGERSLTFFGKGTIEKGQIWKEIKKQLRNPKSVPALIRNYFNTVKIKLVNSMLYKTVNTFQTVIEEYQLTQEQIEYVFQFMITNNILVFNYVYSRLPEILQLYNKKTEKKVSGIRYNNDDYYINSALDDLKDGIETYDKIIKIYGRCELFQTKIIGLLKEKKYNNRFSAIEWLYKINLPLTKDIYFLAKHIVNEQQSSLYHFSNDMEINKFKSWLRTYKNKFES